MKPKGPDLKPLYRRAHPILAGFLALAVVGCPAPEERPADPDVAQLDISPHNIQASDDASLVLIVGPTAGPAHDDGHVHGDAGQLVVLDPGTLEEARPAIPAGEHPAHVVVDEGNRFAYITDSGPDVVLVVDLSEGRVVQEVPTCAYPHGLRMSPDGRELAVACVESNEVAVIDVHARQVLRSIPVGRGPIQLFATPDGRFMYAANEGTAEEPDSTVSVIEIERGAVVETVTTGAGAHGVVVSADGRLALISNLFDNTVSVIDVATQRVVATHAVGEGPAGITFVRRGR